MLRCKKLRHLLNPVIYKIVHPNVTQLHEEIAFKIFGSTTYQIQFYISL